MKILICIGANSRITQKCLEFCKEFSIIHLFYRSPYQGNISEKYVHHKYQDAINLLNEIQRTITEADADTSFYLLYSSYFTRRLLPPEYEEVWDSALSISLQSLVLNSGNVQRLILLGSTQALFYPFKSDFYLKYKRIELKNFQINSMLDKKSKICYFALPPLDKSSNIFGMLFVRSREDCAKNIVKEFSTETKFCSPLGIYYWIAYYICGNKILLERY